jgi:hypothetical protein
MKTLDATSRGRRRCDGGPVRSIVRLLLRALRRRSLRRSAGGRGAAVFVHNTRCSRLRCSGIRCGCIDERLHRTGRARLRCTCVLPRPVSVLRLAHMVGTVGVVGLRLLGRMLSRLARSRILESPRLLGPWIPGRLGRSRRLGWARIPRAWYGRRLSLGRWRKPRAFALNARDAHLFTSSLT